MYLHATIATEPFSVSLLDHDDFSSFKLVVEGGSSQSDLRRALGSLGELPDASTALLRIDGVIELAGARAADSDWRAAFDAMVEYARGHGWMTDDGLLAAHCEWQET